MNSKGFVPSPKSIVHDVFAAIEPIVILYVIEPSLGADRVVLAFLCNAYDEEEIAEGDVRTVLHLHPVVMMMLQTRIVDKLYLLTQKLMIR